MKFCGELVQIENHRQVLEGLVPFDIMACKSGRLNWKGSLKWRRCCFVSSFLKVFLSVYLYICLACINYSIFNQLFRELAQADNQRQTYLKALEEAQREKAQLERQLETEKMKVETERKKLLLAQESLNDKVRPNIPMLQ